MRTSSKSNKVSDSSRPNSNGSDSQPQKTDQNMLFGNIGYPSIELNGPPNNNNNFMLATTHPQSNRDHFMREEVNLS